jgi:hypothetical protein
MRRVFTISYLINGIDDEPTASAADGKGERFRALMHSTQPSPELLRPTYAWIQAAILGDLRVLTHIEDLKNAWGDYVEAAPEPVLMFANMGSIAYSIQSYYWDLVQFLGTEQFYRNTRKPEYQSSMDTFSSRVKRRVPELRTQTADMARECRRWSTGNLCPPAVADAFQQMRALLDKSNPAATRKQLDLVLDTLLVP